MVSDLSTLAGLVALALLAYAALGLIVPFLRSFATDLFPAPTRPCKDEAVQIVVTTPSGKDITLPLRPDSEDSIRDFLRKAEAATSG